MRPEQYTAATINYPMTVVVTESLQFYCITLCMIHILRLREYSKHSSVLSFTLKKIRFILSYVVLGEEIEGAVAVQL